MFHFLNLLLYELFQLCTQDIRPCVDESQQLGDSFFVKGHCRDQQGWRGNQSRNNNIYGIIQQTDKPIVNVMGDLVQQKIVLEKEIPNRVVKQLNFDDEDEWVMIHLVWFITIMVAIVADLNERRI